MWKVIAHKQRKQPWCLYSDHIFLLVRWCCWATDDMLGKHKWDNMSHLCCCSNRNQLWYNYRRRMFGSMPNASIWAPKEFGLLGPRCRWWEPVADIARCSTAPRDLDFYIKHNLLLEHKNTSDINNWVEIREEIKKCPWVLSIIMRLELYQDRAPKLQEHRRWIASKSSLSMPSKRKRRTYNDLVYENGS